jgi:hypothetical protein
VRGVRHYTWSCSLLNSILSSTAKTLGLTVPAGLFEEVIESNTGHFRYWHV